MIINIILDKEWNFDEFNHVEFIDMFTKTKFPMAVVYVFNNYFRSLESYFYNKSFWF